MNNEEFQQRISGMKTDIFPLDRMLPPETVFSIFLSEYNKRSDKSAFFKDRKFQRLREGYFAVFIALALDDLAGGKHHMVIPSDPASDVIMVRTMEGGDSFPAYRFDIKEFTDFSGSFANFVEKTIIPKVGIYNLVIATHRDINSGDLQSLLSSLRTENASEKVWLVGSPSKEGAPFDISKVTVVDKDAILYDKIIDLNKRLDMSRPSPIYQDKLREK